MTDVARLDAPLVVGAGVAGFSVALSLPCACVVAAPEMGSSWLAQGGIAAAMATGDSPRRHARDTLAAAGGIAVESAVEALTTGGRDAIDRLVRYGAEFDRDDDGELVFAQEAGHGVPRVAHADGDATGAEVMRALGAAIGASDQHVLLHRRVVDLVVAGDRVAGIVTAEGKHREVLLAPAVVLATGGACRLWSQTTNPAGPTGEGIAMAARVGARLVDLEFAHFHPMALHVGKDPMPVIPQVLRYEGAMLVDAHGRRFMPKYHPDAELAPVGILSRAIFSQYANGLDGAYLDASAVINLPDRFPTMTAHAHSVDLDPTQHLLPVYPSAHFFIGGIETDLSGRTSVPGLWAVGECASTGAHGADRLPSNAMLEGLVFAARVAADVAESLQDPVGQPLTPKEALDLPLVAGPALEDLRQLMWEGVGPVRTASGLAEVREGLAELGPVLRRTVAGRAAADLSPLIVEAAARRTESRGCHHRLDFPEPDPAQARRNTVDPAPAELAPIT